VPDDFDDDFDDDFVSARDSRQFRLRNINILTLKNPAI